jgi:hypothetical protein
MKCLLCGGETDEFIGRHHRCLVCGFQWWLQWEMMGLQYEFDGQEIGETPLGCLTILPGEERV